MAQAVTPTNGYIWSSAELRKGVGQRGPFFNFLDKRLSFADKFFRMDDFDNKTLDTNLWAVATGTTGSTLGAILLPGSGTTTGLVGIGSGWMRMAGTTDGGASIIGPLEYFGTQNCGMEVKMRIAQTSANNSILEIGFVDSLPAGGAQAILDIDTPVAATTNASLALFAIDPSQTLKTSAFVTAGSSAGTAYAIKATTLPFIQGGVATTTATFVPPVDGSVFTVRIELRGGTAYCFVNGYLAARHQTLAAGNVTGFVNPTTALAPWIWIKGVILLSTIHVDYIAVWQDRVGGG